MPIRLKSGLFVAAAALFLAMCCYISMPPGQETKRPTVVVQPLFSAPSPTPSLEKPPLKASSPLNLPEILAAVRPRLAASASTEEILCILRNAALTNPREALQAVDIISRSGGETFTFVSGIVESWASAAPDEAWRWALNEPSREHHPALNILAATIIHQLVEQNPAAAIDCVEAAFQPGGWPPIRESECALTQLADTAARALLRAGRVELAQATIERWLREYPGKAGYLPVQTVALTLAKQSPLTATQWLLSLPDSPERDQVIPAVAADWAETDPVAAMSWAETLKRPDRAQQVVFERWLDLNQAEAMHWLRSYLGRQKPAAEADALISKVSDTFSMSGIAAPEVIIQWVARISDPSLRRQSLEKVFHVWKQHDRRAMQNYLQSAPEFSEREKVELSATLQTAQ